MEPKNIYRVNVIIMSMTSLSILSILQLLPRVRIDNFVKKDMIHSSKKQFYVNFEYVEKCYKLQGNSLDSWNFNCIACSMYKILIQML